MAQTLYTITNQDVTTSHYQRRGHRYILKIRDLPVDEKPREKLNMLGPGALTVSELVAILLGVGTKKEEVMSMAERILKEYGERAIINEKSPKKLAEVVDIPIGKAAQIIAALEIGRRFFSEKYGRPAFIKTSAQAYQYLKPIGSLKKEQLRALYLNSRYQIIHDEVISVGSLTANIVHPREVFQPAVEHGAVAVIIAHNHPSGSLDPSAEDISVTNQLVDGGKILGIELLDHLIINTKSYSSIINQ